MGFYIVYHLGNKYGIEMNERGHWFIFEYHMHQGDWKLYRVYLDSSKQDPFRRGSDSSIEY